MGNCSNNMGCSKAFLFVRFLSKYFFEHLLYAQFCLFAESLITVAGALMMRLAMRMANYITLAIFLFHKDSWNQIDHAVIRIDC